jgi:hypothetical protein
MTMTEDRSNQLLENNMSLFSLNGRQASPPLSTSRHPPFASRGPSVIGNIKII